jgi:hypothetical protein
MVQQLCLSAMVVVLAASMPHTALARNSLSRTPPMGWMSWEIFRCETDCANHPDTCISENLYKAQTDALAEGGYVDVGYTGIHMDDCWENKTPKRNTTTGRLYPNPDRFPSGLKALGDYMHSKGATFGLYTAESPTTCGGYPASANSEDLDAKTFAEWGVDYLKVDGCGATSYYEHGYQAMGAALEASGRDIVYSCSWPAYIGDNESTKPFSKFIMDGCNLWRNWADIQCNWGSLSGIIDHWGEWAPVLAPYAGPGHWHDMDMLLVGNTCVSHDEERTQMAIWSIMAAPLIMGNGLRNVSAESKSILLNKDAIAVNQDPLGQMGLRLSNTSEPTQVWARNLANGDVAVALFNKGAAQPMPDPSKPCTSWNHTTGGYIEACGGAAGNVGSFSNLSREEAMKQCCANKKCAGFSFHPADGSGFFKANAQCGFQSNSAYEGYTKPSQIPMPGTDATISVSFADINMGLNGAPVKVYDIWAQKDLGAFTGKFSQSVPFHGSAFLRLSAK